MSLRDLTDEEYSVMMGLLEKVNEFLEDTEGERVGREHDNGFNYDYGSITNAWHSEYEVEINNLDWGTFCLDAKGIPDYILDHLVETCNYEHSTVLFTITNTGEEYDATAEWTWGREKDVVYLHCDAN